MIADRQGHRLSGATAEAAGHFDRAVRDGVHRAWVADAERAFEASGVGGTSSGAGGRGGAGRR